MHEKEIIELIINRDEQGLTELIKYYGSLIKYIISPILHNTQDQEECLSEVTMKIWDKIHSYDQKRGSWTSWLTAITRNTALNRAKRNTKWENSEDISENTSSTHLTPEEIVMRQEQQESLNKAIHNLSQKEQILFYRKYYYLQSTSQIASELNITYRAAEGKLYRLKKKLCKMLGGDKDE